MEPGSWWWTRRPSVLQSMGSQKVRHNWVTELMRNPNIEVRNITKLGQMTFNAWLGYFEYVSYLPRGITIYCSHLMSQFDRYQLQLVYPSIGSNIQQEISSTKLCKPLFDTFYHSQHILHILHFFFFLAFQLHFTFLEVIKHDMLKMLLFSSIFINMLHKTSPILIRFLKCKLIGQLSQYSLTKWFWMKLKTAKHYRSHLMEQNE